MFENLTEKFSKTLRALTGRAHLTESNIQETLDEVRKTLLEADVALEVVDAFVQAISKKAVGTEIKTGLSPAQFFVKIVHEELLFLMGEANVDINLKTTPPAVILMAGLQGSGKTTTVAKLAKYLKEHHKKSVMVVSADIYRPAAIEQLKTLATDIQVEFFPSNLEEKPTDIAKNALLQAKKQGMDVLIVDSAGRLHIDDQMMSEIKEVHKVLNPIETLFVVDSMTGQDAAKSAKAFDQALPLTGIVLTKTDGDARGGAALSIRYITGKPIKFIGVGEKVSALEPFHPDRLATRILGMGDVLSLIEQIEQKVDKAEAEKLAKKLQKGKGFDLEDYRDQLKQMLNMGGLASMMEKLPGMGMIPQAAKAKMDDKMLVHSIAIINSMTPKERRFPAIISGSRKQRIAKGSGTQPQQISQLLKQHEKMQKMMKKVAGMGGINKLMRGLQGRLPPGMFPGG